MGRKVNPSTFKKDRHTSVRINSDNLKSIIEIYGSLQAFLDDMIDNFIDVEIYTSIKGIQEKITNKK